jgi:hypothetical protein
VRSLIAIVVLQTVLLGGGPLRQAEQALREGNTTAALIRLEQAMLDYPALSSEIRLRQAQIYLGIDSLGKAESLWREASVGLTGRNKAVALQNIAIQLYRRGKVVDALVALRLALIADPTYERARSNFELIARLLPPEPPEPPPPPPPPPKSSPAPKETAGEAAKMTERSRIEALDAIAQLKRRDKPYLQQNKKVLPGRRDNGPPW